MPGRIVRSRTADLVTQLIESRDGRNHLRSHGWEDGMAIVMTQPSEPLEDVMGLVSIHRGAVLVAMIDGMTKDLRFVHVSEISAAAARCCTIGSHHTCRKILPCTETNRHGDIQSQVLGAQRGSTCPATFRAISGSKVCRLPAQHVQVLARKPWDPVTHFRPWLDPECSLERVFL